MLTAFMVSRPLRRWLATGVLAAISLNIGACQKVPLLAPTGSTITVTAGSTALSVNGTTDIIAMVLEAAGTAPQDGTLVTFTTTLGSIQPSEARTNGGRVTVKFSAGTANGTAVITATSGGAGSASTTGANATATNVARIAIGTAAVGSVRVSANPTLLPTTGGSSTIAGTVIDINGNPLSSAPVTFSTTTGTLEQVAVSTDANGIATAVLRTTTAATVTVAVGAQAGSSTPPATGAPAAPAAPATGTASGSVTVNVTGSPTLLITAPTTGLTAGLSAAFTFAVTAATTNGNPIRDVVVDWGDGQNQNLGATTGTVTVSHVFRSPGSYLVVGRVTDTAGNQVTTSTSVTVNPKPQPVVSITATTANPTAGVDMVFTASIAPVAGNGTVIQSASIDFGDGTSTPLGAVTGTAIALHHVYQNAGQYPVTLTATDSNGGVGTAFTTVFVQAATPLTVLLSATSTPSGANTTETFTATVIGLGNSVVVNYHWVFGSTLGTADTSSNTQTRTYAAGSGTITVTVTITTSTGAQASGSTVIVIP
jgi:Bacterial Ig-like domain (group 1)/PKD domain